MDTKPPNLRSRTYATLIAFFVFVREGRESEVDAEVVVDALGTDILFRSGGVEEVRVAIRRGYFLVVACPIRAECQFDEATDMIL